MLRSSSYAMITRLCYVLAINGYCTSYVDSRGVRACVVSPTYCKTYGFYAVELSTILNKYRSVCDYWNYKYLKFTKVFSAKVPALLIRQSSLPPKFFTIWYP